MKKKSKVSIKGIAKKSKNKLLPFLCEGKVEAGCDEAGRGCLAGPVFAAAVILPPRFRSRLLNDSKELTKEQRDILRPLIEKEALAWAVEMVSNEEIDQVNILNASFLAMNRAVQKLKIVPEHLLIDGHMFRPQVTIPYTCLIKGDGRFMAIAAASVLAKTWRDEYMGKLHEEFPLYNWRQNKGYPTLQHRDAISIHGITKYHRLSFKLTDLQLELEF
jgi:ribonuclease HII